jgi:signal transduction histidine kinase
MQRLKQFKIGTGNPIIFPATDIDEFHFLNDNLASTIQQAEHEYNVLKEFTENASHEMQTPVAIVRSKLDLLIQQEYLSEDQAEIIRSAYSGIKRLHKLNQSLLLLTKIENRQFEERAYINLKEKVTEKMEQLHEVWNETNITVEAHLEDAIISANEVLIDILLNNLFSNAGRHNIANGYISVILQQGTLTITNLGSDAPLDTHKMFQRFYKGSQHSRNNGLGLSIIKQICDHSGIQVTYRQVKHEHHFTLCW